LVFWAVDLPVDTNVSEKNTVFLFGAEGAEDAVAVRIVPWTKNLSKKNKNAAAWPSLCADIPVAGICNSITSPQCEI
jgi:hypothetical protein